MSERFPGMRLKETKNNTTTRRLLDEETEKKVREKLKASIRELLNEYDMEQWPNIISFCIAYLESMMMSYVAASKPMLEKAGISVSSGRREEPLPGASIPEQFRENLPMRAFRELCADLGAEYEREAERMGLTEAPTANVRPKRKVMGNPFIYGILMQLGFAGIDMLSDHFKADHPAFKMLKKFRRYFNIQRDEENADLDW